MSSPATQAGSRYLRYPFDGLAVCCMQVILSASSSLHSFQLRLSERADVASLSWMDLPIVHGELPGGMKCQDSLQCIECQCPQQL